ncbi:MAG: DEAD/DEAH box helicase family protein, partial [Gallionella sp.]
MNEAETRAEHIDPALKAAGWGVVEGSKVLREYRISEGRLHGARQRGTPEIADYVLVYRGHKLAVLEAKRWDLPHSTGLAQAKSYAHKIRARFGYATNGQRIYGVDMHSGAEGDVASYPSPDELWNQTYASVAEPVEAWRERFAAVPVENKGGLWDSRYYQDSAIDAVLEAVAANQQRILLTLATGTGKTYIAFQLAWKLFHARWNLQRDATRRPRILFLADRNILANQAFNSFSPFAEDALVRIAPADIRKKGGVPKNGNVFFTIFQTFASTGSATDASKTDASKTDTSKT